MFQWEHSAKATTCRGTRNKNTAQKYCLLKKTSARVVVASRPCLFWGKDAQSLWSLICVDRVFVVCYCTVRGEVIPGYWGAGVHSTTKHGLICVSDNVIRSLCASTWPVSSRMNKCVVLFSSVVEQKSPVSLTIFVDFSEVEVAQSTTRHIVA